MSTSDTLPLSEPIFLILLSLTDGPSHGYAILRQIEELSEGRVRLGTGTLYGGLKRILDAGWIRRVPSDQPESGRERHRYELTPLGRDLLRAETERYEQLSRVSRVRLSETEA